MRHATASIERETRDTAPSDFDAGYFDYQARAAFRDLRRIHGFEEARQIMADIINSEDEGKRQ